MEKTLNHRGEKIFYRLSGSGNPLILIHGFAEDGTIWDQQARSLKDNFRLVIPDIPGSGRSTGNGRFSDLQDGPAMDDYADCIKAIADAEQINSCVVIGHSMGGYIALAFAEKYAGYLKGFGLFHSTAYADTGEKKTSRRKSIGFINQYGSAAFIRQSIPNLFSEAFKKTKPELVSACVERYTNFNPGSLVSYYEAMIGRPDRTSVLKGFGKPVLFIIGEQDKAVPLDQALEQSHMPRLSYIHILESAAHMGMLECIDRSNRIMEDFLTQLFF